MKKLKEYNVIYCIDRATQDEFDMAFEVGKPYDNLGILVNSDEGTFKAGKMRNLGYKAAIERGAKLIISLDGDMIPEDLTAYQQGFPIMVGKRREEQFLGFDQREIAGTWLKNIFFEDKLNKPYDDYNQYIEHCGVLWSCNIAFTREFYENYAVITRNILGNTVFSGNMIGMRLMIPL